MPLVCIVTLEMCRPHTNPEHYSRWKAQRDRGDQDCLWPDAYWHVRRWVGSPECRDWERLEGQLHRQGWGTISHRREFVKDGAEIVDKVTHA